MLPRFWQKDKQYLLGTVTAMGLFATWPAHLSAAPQEVVRYIRIPQQSISYTSACHQNCVAVSLLWKMGCVWIRFFVATLYLTQEYPDSDEKMSMKPKRKNSGPRDRQCLPSGEFRRCQDLKSCASVGKGVCPARNLYFKSRQIRQELCPARRRELLNESCKDFVSEYGDPVFYRKQLGQPFNVGWEFPWKAENLAQIVNNPAFDLEVLAAELGVCPSRLRKVIRDSTGREVIGTGVILRLIVCCGFPVVLREVPNETHGAIAGICRVAPALKYLLLTKRAVKQVVRDPVLPIKTGIICFEFAKSEKFASLMAINWAQVVAEDGGISDHSILSLLAELIEEANRLISETPLFAEAIGMIDHDELPLRLAEAIVAMPYWYLATELLWECVERSQLPTLGIFDPFRLNGRPDA